MQLPRGAGAPAEIALHPAQAPFEPDPVSTGEGTETGMTRDYPQTADGAVLQGLAKQGHDMGAVMLIDFHVLCPDAEAAQRVTKRVRKKGFEADAAADCSDGNWTVTIPVQMIPDHDEIVDFQTALDEDRGGR